ncbi:uncharacterized protein LOC115918749 [Strongylocentrotus purpuratus]|uniref:Uncharacterized protein n=1 Tax=Strongylocentrotus purpuratus TaxID=7668 RepID=A0A7M7T0M1_STRPU|nr:uncharacterized protein LOC115918749 [Strongylocentrotus purpuratus]|eukprot:XP_003724878.1 PREDICTED: uncharacterized protein LOC100888573 [Strongylocentrotus purpuratus]
MAPIILAMILLGIAAKVNARPYNQDNEVGSVDNNFEIEYRLAAVMHALVDTCANRAENSAPDVEQLFDVVCLVLNGEGSGEGPVELGTGEGFRELGSGEFPEEQSPRWIYNFDPIVKTVTSDRIFQQTLSMIVEGACQAAVGSGYVASDIESFCRNNRRSSDASVGDEIGSGDGFSSSVDVDNDAVNKNDLGGFSISWDSGNNDWLDDDPFFFANLGGY